MKQRLQRIMGGLLLLCLLAGGGFGCRPEEEMEPADNPVEQGDTQDHKDSIVIATMSETPSLSPTGHNSVAGNYMNLLTYSTLFRIDMQMTPQPHLCQSYETMSDTKWRFTLHQGVRFHDGTELTARDVKASLEWAKGFPEVKQYTDSIQSVEVVDDHTIEITTPEPSAVLLNDLATHATAIVPKHLIDNGNDFNKNPVGSGPYRFTNWVLGDRLEFEAFADYFAGEPPISHMTWKIIPKGAERTVALESGEVDFIVEVETMDAQRLRENGGVQVLEFLSTGPNWLMLNNESPGLDNVNVRKAIDCAIDKEEVIRQALDGMGEVATSQTPFNLPGASDENAEPHSLQRAKTYMSRSGVSPSAVQMSIICSSEAKRRAAEVIQQDLGQIGIRCGIESMDLATYLATTTEGNYTAAIGGYTPSTMIGYMTAVLHSKSIGSTNKTRLSDPALDALIDKAAVTVDQAEREELLRQASARANDLCTQVPLYQAVELRAYNSGLSGVEVNPSGQLYFEYVSWNI